MDGYLFGGICYSTELLALSKYYANQTVNTALAGNNIVTTQIYQSGSDYQLTYVGRGLYSGDVTSTGTYTLVNPTFPICEVSNSNPFEITVPQALEVSAAIALCWAIVYGFKMAISALNVTTSNGGYDDD